MSYTLSVEDGHAFEADELFKTNGDTTVEYNNPKWPGDPDSPEPKRTSTSVESPEVEVSKIKVKKTVTNDSTNTKDFVIRVTDPKGRLMKFTLKSGESDYNTKFTEVGEYKIVEMVDANGYSVKYKVDGVEKNTFTINEVTDVKDSQIINIEVENTALPYNESYVFESATPGEELPPEVLALLPTGRTGLLNDTSVDAIQPAQTEVVIDINRTWKFLGYDQDTKIVEGADIQFVGQWVLEYTPTYDVNYEYVSGTPGMDLPEEIKNWTPESVKDQFENTHIDAEQPQHNELEVEGGKWVFDGYNKDSVTITNSDELFTGTWKFIENKYNVTYEYLSATPDVELPDEVKALTPPDDTELINGTHVDAAHPTKSEVTVADGKWIFNGYGDKDSVTINGADEHFIGTWEYTPNPHKATYDFVSGTPGRNLPEEVLALLPADDNTYFSGDEVTAITPNETSVKVPGGKWTFKSYDSDSKTVDGADVNFEGIWVFEEDTYEVTYKYESATPGKTLPQEVIDLTPEGKGGFTSGSSENAEAPAQTEVEVADGKWVFKSYYKNSASITDHDDEFVGVWEFMADEPDDNNGNNSGNNGSNASNGTSAGSSNVNNKTVIKAVRTGDENSMVLWVALMLVAVAGTAVVALKRRSYR